VALRASTSRHVVWRACGSLHTSGAKVSRSTRRRWAAVSGLWLGWRPATPAMLCRCRGGTGANAHGSGWREGPRRIDGDARNSTRTDSCAAPLPWGCTGRIGPASGTGPLRRYGRLSVQDRSNWQHCSVLSKNQALTLGVNTWPPRAGCLLTGRRKGDRYWLIAPSRTATISTTAFGTAHVALAPRLATPAQLKGYHARYFVPKRLDGRARSNTGWLHAFEGSFAAGGSSPARTLKGQDLRAMRRCCKHRFETIINA